MVLVISLLVVVCSLYSLTYTREYEGKGAAAIRASSDRTTRETKRIVLVLNE